MTKYGLLCAGAALALGAPAFAQAQTIRVEYDATRLNAAIVAQLVRRAGINITEELPLIPPQSEPAAEPAPAPAK